MIRLGTALKSQEPPFHRCLVISDPHTNGGQIVLVRVTFGPAVKALEAAIQRGLFQEILPPPLTVLNKVILAGRSSAGMPPGAKKLLAQMI